MNLEDQVCTIDQSYLISSVFPNLKSIFGWFVDPSDLKEIIIMPMVFVKDADEKGWIYLHPAFTTSELGALLGDYYVLPGKFGWIIKKRGQPNIVQHRIPHLSFGAPEAEVRADALLLLLKNKRILPEEILL